MTAKGKKDTTTKEPTIAERLTRRAHEQRITIPFPSSGGPINVEVRLPTVAELDDLMATQSALFQRKGDQKKLVDHLNAIIGGLCIDPSLDAKFWSGRQYATEDMFQVITEIVAENRRRVTNIQSFRYPPEPEEV